MKIIGVYGSLKKGCYNYDRFRFADRASFLGNTTIAGPMYMIGGAYPALFPQTNTHIDRMHDLEVYEIDDSLFTMLEGMENGAGYELHSLDFTVDEIERPVNVWLAGPSIAVSSNNYIEKYPV